MEMKRHGMQGDQSLNLKDLTTGPCTEITKSEPASRVFRSEAQVLVGNLREAWRSREWDAVIAATGALLEKLPMHLDALKMRLKAALNANALMVAAEAAIAAAESEPALALIAVKKLMGAGESVAAARVLLAIRRTGSIDIDGFSDVVAKQASIMLNAGFIAEAEGDKEQAELIWCLGAAVAPESIALRRNVMRLLADAVERAKRIDLATDRQGFIDAWGRVLSLDPGHNAAIKRLARAADMGEDANYAMECWAHLLEVDAASEVAPQRLARAASRANREHEALAILHDSGLTSSGAKHVTSLKHKVRSACKASLRGCDGFGAAGHLSLILQVGPADDETELLKRKCIGLLARELKGAYKSEQLSTAAAIGSRLLLIDPDNTLALAATGRYAYQLCQFAEAARYYERLTDIAPEVASNWLHLARARNRAGDIVGAAAAAEQSRALAPDNRASENLGLLLKTKLSA